MYICIYIYIYIYNGTPLGISGSGTIRHLPSAMLRPAPASAGRGTDPGAAADRHLEGRSPNATGGGNIGEWNIEISY